MTNRREFVIQAVLGSGVLATGQAFAAAPMVAETDPTAVSLAYKADGSKTDKAKFPQVCGVAKLWFVCLVSGQAHRCIWRLPVVCWQAGCYQRLVQRLGQKSLKQA